MSSEILKKLAELSKDDKMLGSPVRLAIMMLLYFKVRMKFTELQMALGLTPGNLSSHLRKLEKANYIKIIKGFVNLRPATIVEITPLGVKKVKEFALLMKNILSSVENLSRSQI